MHRAISSRLCTLLAMVGLLLMTAWLYAPALRFGFMWDDPIWYGRVMGKSFAALVRPMPDYQFYRPGVALYNRFFMRHDQTFPAPIMHAVQIGWHLLNIALVYALCRRLKAGNAMAMIVAGLVACYPFSHQAVAWVAPQQPMVSALQNGAWLAYLTAHRYRKTRWRIAVLSLVLFVSALTIQEITAALALVPFLVDWAQHRRNRVLALVYPFVSAAFVLAWRTLPRPAGYLDWGFRLEVIGYFFQGLIFPLAGWLCGYVSSETTLTPMIIVTGLILAGLLAVAWHTRRLRLALFGLALVLLGIGPSAAGLYYEYVYKSPRLLYYSAPGIALLWACALLPPPDRSIARRLWRISGAILLVLIALQSVLLLTGFQCVYAAGAAHMAEFIQVARTGERLLFVNFPDQFALKRPPYPKGYWGMLLAPGSVDLGEFSALATGERPITFSRRMPWVDGDVRDAGPYQVDMRGELVPADQLYQLAHQVDRVYLSRYHTDGTFALRWAGAVVSPTLPTQACRLAVFGETLCLQDAQVEIRADQLGITLTWVSLSGAQPNDTIFTHLGQVGQPPVAQADGDPWLGILPLTLLQPGDVIIDHRILTLPKTVPCEYEIRVGLYNRVTGERMPAKTPQGEPLPDNAITVGYFP